MTYKDAMKTAGSIRPNALPEEQKAAWLHEVEGRWADVTGAEPPENPWPEDGELSAPSPWNGFYPFYLCAMIGLALQDTAQYYNDMTKFNADFADAAAWWRRENEPESGQRWEVGL